MPVPKLDKGPNGIYYAFWTEGRRSKRTTMGTREVAKATTHFAQWLLMGGPSQRPEEPAKVFTVADLWAAYEAGHKVVATETRRWAWANLSAHFADTLICDVSEAVPGYVAKRQRGLIGKPARSATVRRELVTLRACFNWCADANERRPLIAKTDLPGFALPPDSQPRDRWLKEDEVKRLLDAARSGDRLSRAERFLWLALETAGRKQALLDLTWGRVDFTTNVIHLALPERKQTKKRRASVPISAALRPVLERAYAERTGDLVLDSKAEVWAAVQSVARRAGLAPKVARATGAAATATGISPHVMRHTAATNMARRGVPIYLVAKVLGVTIATAEKTYAKHCPDDLRGAVDMISGK
jgi:integrase